MRRKVMKSWFQAVVAVWLITLATFARGDVPGPLEISVATGYTRGFGSVSGAMPELQHLAANGGTLRVEPGWRIDSRWMIGCYLEGTLLAGGHAGTSGVTGGAAGLQGQLHLAPFEKLDPWIGVGGGWRGIWIDHGSGSHAMQGVDLARLQVGLDYRVSQRFSMAPVVGVSLTEFLSEKPPGASADADIADRKVSTFLFAGLSGRFDLLGGASPRS